MHHIITYKVDGETEETDLQELTPNQILQSAAIDPSKNYLVELRGHDRVSYEETADTEIHMHEHMEFVSVSRGPMTVS